MLAADAQRQRSTEMSCEPDGRDLLVRIQCQCSSH
jgi:hypothetical protein